MKLSDKVRIIRKARGYSQEQLGYLLQKTNTEGISRQTISDWENDKFEPKLNNIRNLAEVLDVSFDVLLNEDLDLDDKNTLNVALKHLSDETKNKINSSFRYNIYAYNITKKDYIMVFVYFLILLIGFIAGIISISLLSNFNNAYIITCLSGSIILCSLCIINLPISWIKKIKKGGDFSPFGTLSQTHFVIIGWSDINYDRTIYVPVSKIESMKLGGSPDKKHGVVLVYIKGRTKPLVTSDIMNPQKLIHVFNNLDIFVNSMNKGHCL